MTEPASEFKSFRLVGVQRSGTTWTSVLFGNLANVSALRKHALPQDGDKTHMNCISYTLLVRKRLDHWLASIARDPVNLPRARSFMFPDGKNGPPDMFMAAEFYKVFYETWEFWLESNGHPYQYVWYEELLKDPLPYVEEIGAKFGLSFPDRKRLIKTAGPYKLPEPRRDYYLEQGCWAPGPSL